MAVLMGLGGDQGQQGEGQGEQQVAHGGLQHGYGCCYVITTFSVNWPARHCRGSMRILTGG
jgi:hypothetical protein